jgi:hypothetical protein
VITDEPRMPAITATAVGVGGAASELEWKIRVDFGARGCPPFGPDDLRTDFSLSQKGGNEITTDVFGSIVRGGLFSLSFSAQGTVNGCQAFGGRSELSLVGTNPQQSAIRATLPHDTLRRIACKESGQRQFDAPPNGGTGGCPLFGPGGKVGIMQIANPTGDEVWDWRENVKKGIEIFTKIVDQIRGNPDKEIPSYPSRVRDSDEFKLLVVQFNQKRQQQGLNPIEIVLPDFEIGNFDDDNDLQQLEVDAIRGYNGWNGSDRFGFELHEFRVAVELIDGQEVLAVANVNEEALQGEAVWEGVPVEDRPGDIGSPSYVDDVLALQFDCAPSTTPLIVDIREEDGTAPPRRIHALGGSNHLCRILAIGASRKYRAFVSHAGGTFKWTCTGGASIVGSASRERVTVEGKVESTLVDDVVLTLLYKRGGRSKTQEIKLTVADVKKISVRVKASAAVTPGRGAGLADQQFDSVKQAEDFPADDSLILLCGGFEDVELQATVKPDGTPLAWDVKRAKDDAPSLGRGTPTLDQDPLDKTKAKLGTNETGSFFVRAFADCGDQKFAANGPFKLVPTVLVQATLQVDASESRAFIAQTTKPSIVDGTLFLVDTGTGPLSLADPSTAAIHMLAFVKVVSGGPEGRLLIERVFAGWVNNQRAENDSGSYTGGHSIQTVFATNSGTGPRGLFKPGDQPQLVAPPVSDTAPLLDTTFTGKGGDTATVDPSLLPNDRENLNPGQRLKVEAVVSPASLFYPLLHPVSTVLAPVILQSFHFEQRFTANLCLWTNRSDLFGDVADHSYGVLHSYDWDMHGAWSIDADNNITVDIPMEVTISPKLTYDPLARPNSVSCEVCAPIALDLKRLDGRT